MLSALLSKKKRFGTLFLVLVVAAFFINLQTVDAQTASNNSVGSVEGAATLGLATLYPTTVKNIKDGSVVSNSEKGAILSIIPYDSQVLGVVSRDAAIQISTSDSPNTIPVMADGSVYVLVSTQQGNIQKGDYLTTSTIPGVAVKATQSGYVLGTALEDYSSSSPTQTGLIAVDLNLHYFNTKPTLAGSLSDLLKLALLPASANSPSPIFKYIVAALVVLASLILAFLTFGRTAAKGVEALGRNPAASTIIHIGIIFNVGIVVVIVFAGLAVAFMILRL